MLISLKAADAVHSIFGEFPRTSCYSQKKQIDLRAHCASKATTFNFISSFSPLACIRQRSREKTRNILKKTIMANCSIIYSFYISITKTYVQYVKETFCGYNFTEQTSQPNIPPCKTLNREHDNSGGEFKGKLKRKLNPTWQRQAASGLVCPT